MIETFQIFGHIITSIGANDIQTNDFLTNNDSYAVENMVSNIAKIAGPGAALCSMFDGQVGTGASLLQSQSMDATQFLPLFQTSEATDSPWFLSPTQRVSFTYQNLTGSVLPFVQSVLLGHKVLDNGYGDAITIRPMQYVTPFIVVSAASPNSIQITTDVAYDFLCRAFTFFDSLDLDSTSVMIRNVGTGYQYMNTPVLLRNFCYSFAGGEINNFRPYPFTPFIIPARTTLEFTFYNLNAMNATTVAVGLFGNHCTKKS